VYNAHNVAPDPDLFAFCSQMHSAGALEGGALGRDIWRFGKSRADEPLCEARVEAAGDRIFVPAGPRERSHLECRVVACLMRTYYAYLEGSECDPVDREREHLTGGAEHYRAPTRAIVYPLMVDDI